MNNSKLAASILEEEKVSYLPSMVKLFGSFPAGILVTEILELAVSSNNELLRLDPEIVDILGLTESQFIQAKRILVSTGIVSTERHGRNGNFYRLDIERLQEIIDNPPNNIKELVVQKEPPKESAIRVRKNAITYAIKLKELEAAFKTNGTNFPVVVDYGTKAIVKGLLGSYTPDDIAQCWSDIEAGRFGGKDMAKYLSFGFLARNNTINKWKQWVENGGDKSDKRKYLDSESVKKYNDGW